MDRLLFLVEFAAVIGLVMMLGVVPRGLTTSQNSTGLTGPLEWTRKPVKLNQDFGKILAIL